MVGAPPSGPLGKSGMYVSTAESRSSCPSFTSTSTKVSVSGLVMDAMPNRVVSVFGVRSSQLAKPKAR